MTALAPLTGHHPGSPPGHRPVYPVDAYPVVSRSAVLRRTVGVGAGSTVADDGGDPPASEADMRRENKSETVSPGELLYRRAADVRLTGS
ncbi:hypothetical protein [Rhodococcus koreensis]